MTFVPSPPDLLAVSTLLAELARVQDGMSEPDNVVAGRLAVQAAATVLREIADSFDGVPVAAPPPTGRAYGIATGH